MLRRIYRCVLRLHPPGFRRRFGDEILSIFDQAKGTLSGFRLLTDSILSLIRQWTLRPEFWHEIPAASSRQVALDGLPSFSTLDPFRPRPVAVIPAVVIAATLFTVTCFAIRYSWIHVLHVHIPAIEFEISPAIHRTASPSELRGAPSSPLAKEVSTAPSQPGDVAAHLYVEPLPVEAEDPAPPSDAPALHSKNISAAPARPMLVPATVDISLESYAGTYVSDSPLVTISIKVRDGKLVINMNGQPPQSLSPLSESTFEVEGKSDTRMEFSSARDGKFHRLHLSQPGMQITASRQ